MELEIALHRGDALGAWIDRTARMRLEVFSGWPYLYEGTLEIERKYFEAFQGRSGAVVVEARLDGEFAGLATAIAFERDLYILSRSKEIFRAAGEDPGAFFYLGELLVEPRCRGRGIGRALLEEVRAEGRSQGLSRCCLMAVERPLDHPSRPRDFREPVPLWVEAGFRRLAGTALFPYPTRLPGGDVADLPNPMRFWVD